MQRELNFEIGFWHPFGPHCDETPAEIIERKRKEIRDNGWTLWSFQYRTPETLKAWYSEIIKQRPKYVLVFCSDGTGAKSPKGKTVRCRNYIPITALKSEKIPLNVKVLHHLGDKPKGSAFIIQDIIYPVTSKLETAQWLYQNKKWRSDKIPTRSEYLIRTGRGEPLRKFRAILILKPPYLAEVTM